MGQDTTGGQYGPSWWDVEAAVASLEDEYDCQVAFNITFTQIGSERRPSWWVNAGAYQRRRLTAPARAYGGYGFKGNSGSKTMAAAMLMAVLRLRDGLEAKTEEAQQASLF